MDLKNQTQKRTIKFKALKDDISDFRFVYGNLIYDHKDNPRIQEDRNEPTFTTCIKGTECQFTGLHDKNGKEVFEGDIFELGVVEWIDGAFRFKNSNCYMVIDSHIAHNFEIIGNIFENTELLKTVSSKNKAWHYCL